MLSPPRIGPSAAPASRTVSVWRVTGTGVNGRGSETCATSPVSTAAPITSATSRANAPGTRSANTRGRGATCAVMARRVSPLLQHRPGCQRGSTGAGHVAIRNERETGDGRLLLPEPRVRAHALQEPVAEMGRRLDHAATDEVDARIAVVRGNREEAPERR